MAKRTMKDIERDLTPKEIEAALQVFENDTLPPGKRKSLETIADELGIGVRTLYEWRQKDAFIEYKNALTDRFSANARMRVMQSVISEAEKGNAAMAKLFLQTQSMLTDNKTVEVVGGSPAVDKDEVARRLAALQEKL
ncbi:phBC6A51 family helix-turn-helix protein [Solibacillus silvestris]